MTATTFAAHRGRASPPTRCAATRRTAGGRPTGTARRSLPPGSSTWTTAEDMTRFAAAVLAGTGARDGRAGAGGGGRATARSGWPGRSASSTAGRSPGTTAAPAGMRTMLALDRERAAGAWSCWATPPAGWTGPGWPWPPPTVRSAAVDRPGCPGSPALAAIVAGLRFLIIFVSAALRGRDRLAVVNGLLVRRGRVADPARRTARGSWCRPGSGARWPAPRSRWPRTRCCRAQDLPTVPARAGVAGLDHAAVSLIVLALVVYAL